MALLYIDLFQIDTDLYIYSVLKQWQDIALEIMVAFAYISTGWYHISYFFPISTLNLSPFAAAELTQSQSTSKPHHTHFFSALLQRKRRKGEGKKKKKSNCPFKITSI